MKHYIPKRQVLALGVALALGTGPAFANSDAMLQLLSVLHAKGTIDDEAFQALTVATKADEEHNTEAVAVVAKKAEVAEKAASGSKSGSKLQVTVGDAIKSAEFFGDLRIRYEYRDAQSQLGTPYDTERDRYRYAIRAGVKGAISPQWDYGFRLETGTYGRSPWLTMGQKNYYNSTPNNTLGDKSSTSLNVGQAYLTYKPVDGMKLTAGRMANPLFTSAMVWDADINVEGLSEQYVYPIGASTKLFANAGQWIYSSDSPPSSASSLANYSTGSTFLFATQAGIIQKLTDTVELKAGLTGYTYSKAEGDGVAAGGVLGTTNHFFTGTGSVATDSYINNLSIIEVPVLVTFPIANFKGAVFGDFAHNTEASQRMALDSLSPVYKTVNHKQVLAYNLFPNNHKADGGADAFTFGWAIASENTPALGIMHTPSAKAGNWEFRNYYQRIGLASLDPNLIDSDFFERTNTQGVYMAGSYAPVDGIVTVLKYGLASRFDKNAGTGGTNSDSISTQTINNYQIVQLDMILKW